MFVSMVALFEDTPSLSERGFEGALWQRLQAFHDLDARTLRGMRASAMRRLRQSGGRAGAVWHRAACHSGSFQYVPVDPETGAVCCVEPPLGKAGDYIVFEACMDLIIGLTACSAAQSNNHAFKPIHFEVLDQGAS